jgi:hypothetical protein
MPGRYAVVKDRVRTTEMQYATVIEIHGDHAVIMYDGTGLEHMIPLNKLEVVL